MHGSDPRDDCEGRKEGKISFHFGLGFNNNGFYQKRYGVYLVNKVNINLELVEFFEDRNENPYRYADSKNFWKLFVELGVTRISENF